jgi:hypothetical protein
MGSAALAKNEVVASVITTPVAHAKKAADAKSETNFFTVASNERIDLSLGVFIRFYKALITETEFSQSPF